MSIFLLLHILLLIMSIMYKITRYIILNINEFPKYIYSIEELSVVFDYLEPLVAMIRNF